MEKSISKLSVEDKERAKQKMMGRSQKVCTYTVDLQETNKKNTQGMQETNSFLVF